jgi:opacity protein-like surface antigen
MKKIILILLSLFIFINIDYAQAKDLKGKWSLGLSGGMGFTLSPKEAKDYFSHGFVFSGDLTYMFNNNFGIVPVTFSYTKLSFDKDKFAGDLGIPQSVFEEIDTSVWILGLTPGIIVTSSGESKVRVFGQIGAGFYHFKMSVKADAVNLKEENSENDFGILFGGGIEADLSERMAIVGKAVYNWIATEDESTSFLDFRGGIKFYF